jgi:N-carbamoyl-L-amino-acid hydrolase
MKDAGLEVHVDAAGNLIGRRSGRVPGRGTLMIGSHSDTVPDGGRFDGIAGVLAGLEVARALSPYPLDHALEVVDFLAEEPGEFGVSCVGSRAMAGVLPRAALERRNAHGTSLGTAIASVGGRPESIEEARRADVSAFFELHIEQGPVLDDSGIDLGVVTHLVGIVRVAVTFVGSAAHAGTTPVRLRRDALAGAAEFIGVVEADMVAAAGPAYYVATVGRLLAQPNAANVVSGEVDLTIDVRSDDAHCLEDAVRRLERAACGIAERRLLRIARWERLSENAPATCDPTLQALLASSAAHSGYSTRHLPSGAGHDAAFLARIAPTSMLFVPSVGGRSHCPDEWTDPRQLAAGTEVLARAVQRADAALAARLPGEFA